MKVPSSEAGAAFFHRIDGQGPPVVLIGGLYSQPGDYRRLIAPLAQSYQVITVCPFSTPRPRAERQPGPVVLAAQMADFLQRLRAGPACILGVSAGGGLAADLAIHHPHLIDSLILVSANLWQPATASRGRLIAKSLHLPVPPRPPVPDRALDQIRIPTLIVHGSRDAVAPFSAAERAQAQIAGSQLVRVPGGHGFLFVRPKQLCELVLAFLHRGQGSEGI